MNGVAADHDAVGRHQVAGPEFNDVARDHLVDRQGNEFPVATDISPDRHRPLQRVGGKLGAAFLDDIECDRQRDHGDDDAKARRVACCRGYGCGHEKNCDQRLGKLARDFP